MTVQIRGRTLFIRYRRDKGFHFLEDRLVHSAIVRRSSHMSRLCSWLISPDHRSPCCFSIVRLQSLRRDSKDRYLFQNRVDEPLLLRGDPRTNPSCYLLSIFRLAPAPSISFQGTMLRSSLRSSTPRDREQSLKTLWTLSTTMHIYQQHNTDPTSQRDQSQMNACQQEDSSSTAWFCTPHQLPLYSYSRAR